MRSARLSAMIFMISLSFTNSAPSSRSNVSSVSSVFTRFFQALSRADSINTGIIDWISVEEAITW
jgi:hypothetical protein